MRGGGRSSARPTIDADCVRFKQFRVQPSGCAFRTASQGLDSKLHHGGVTQAVRESIQITVRLGGLGDGFGCAPRFPRRQDCPANKTCHQLVTHIE